MELAKYNGNSRLTTVQVLTYDVSCKIAKKCVGLIASSCTKGSGCSCSRYERSPQKRNEIRHPAIFAFGILVEYGDYGLRIRFPDLELEKKNGAVVEAQFNLDKERHELLSWIFVKASQYRADKYHPAENNCISFAHDMLKEFFRLSEEHSLIKKFRNWIGFLSFDIISNCVNSAWEKGRTASSAASTQGKKSDPTAFVIGNPTLPLRFSNDFQPGVNTAKFRVIMYDMFPGFNEREKQEMRNQLVPYRGMTPEKLYHPVVDIHGFFIEYLKDGIQLIGCLNVDVTHESVVTSDNFETQKTRTEIQEWLYSKRKEYNCVAFNLVYNNCTKFAMEFLKFLGADVKRLPFQMEVQAECFQNPENAVKIKEYLDKNPPRGLRRGRSSYGSY